jgi:DNA-binding GntR family transcriptional regulator
MPNDMKSVVDRVNRRSLVENAAEQLRQSIISGKLSPGTRLLEIEIADQLGVSRGTLREALRILENDKLVESIPGHGSYIKSISERDIRELYSLRSILEQEAIRLAAEHATSNQLQQLQMILEQMFESAKHADLAQVVGYDLDFHRAIWKIANHQRLLLVLEELSLQIKIYLAVQTKLYEDLAVGIADHHEIFKAIQNKDGNRAATLMRDHLESAANTVIAYAHQQEGEK